MLGAKRCCLRLSLNRVRVKTEDRESSLFSKSQGSTQAGRIKVKEVVQVQLCGSSQHQRKRIERTAILITAKEKASHFNSDSEGGSLSSLTKKEVAPAVFTEA